MFSLFYSVKKQGLPFGLRLGIATSIFVILILGCLMAFQEYRDIQQSREDRNLLISQMISPLKVSLQYCKDTAQLQKIIHDLETGYRKHGIEDYRLEIRDMAGHIMASTHERVKDTKNGQKYTTLLKIKSAAIPSGIGYLKIQQNSDKFNYEIEQRWYFWILDLFVTGFCIILSLQFLNYFLFTKPFKVLLTGIRQMEMGYWGGVTISNGAWEFRRIADQFNHLSGELESTIRRLVEAERRALSTSIDCSRSDQPVSSMPVNIALSDGQFIQQKDNTADQQIDAGNSKQQLEDYLWDKTKLLMSSDPQDSHTRNLAKQAWENDAANAERLGLYQLRSALEDSAFRVLFLDQYKALNQELQDTMPTLSQYVIGILDVLAKNLESHQVQYSTLQHRIKHLAGIWKKMNEKDLLSNQIYDLIAIRIIVPDEDTCYQALNVVHQSFEPRLLRFKDYISQPKQNGYRSIHTSVKYNDHLDFEIQIRSADMHKEAEKGEASHWKYKQSSALSHLKKKQWFHWT